MSKTPVRHSITVTSSISAAEGVCEQLLAELETHHFSREDIFAVHLAFEEAFANAARHGNKMDECRKVDIDYSVTNGKVEISLTDGGDGFDPKAVPDPRCGENIYKTSGRGLFLIRSYMDKVGFNKCGNCIYMTKNKSKKTRSGK